MICYSCISSLILCYVSKGIEYCPVYLCTRIPEGSAFLPILQDPLAIMGLLGLIVPFVILGIAIATGVVDIGKGKL